MKNVLWLLREERPRRVTRWMHTAPRYRAVLGPLDRAVSATLPHPARQSPRATLPQRGTVMDEPRPASRDGKEDAAFSHPIPPPEVTAPGSKTPALPVPQPPRLHCPASKLTGDASHCTQSGQAKEMGGTRARGLWDQ